MKQTVFMVLQDSKFVPLIQVTLELSVKKTTTTTTRLTFIHPNEFNGKRVTEVCTFQMRIRWSDVWSHAIIAKDTEAEKLQRKRKKKRPHLKLLNESNRFLKSTW